MPGRARIEADIAGLIMVLSLFLSGKPDDTFPPTKPVRISISALARRFAVSRPHVMNLLRDAEQEGFLRRDGLQGEEILVLPRLADAVQNLFATIFLFQAESAREALADLKTREALADLKSGTSAGATDL